MKYAIPFYPDVALTHIAFQLSTMFFCSRNPLERSHISPRANCFDSVSLHHVFWYHTTGKLANVTFDTAVFDLSASVY